MEVSELLSEEDGSFVLGEPPEWTAQFPKQAHLTVYCQLELLSENPLAKGEKLVAGEKISV